MSLALALNLLAGVVWFAALGMAYVRLGRIAKTLRNLRANCFVTNEQGHRVRYVNASAQARAKAEQPPA